MDAENSPIEILDCPVKTREDNKQYRVIRLANGMKVMLVHDDEVHEDEHRNVWPSCALTVAVGSLSDPIDSHGLAQYLGNARSDLFQRHCPSPLFGIH